MKLIFEGLLTLAAWTIGAQTSGEAHGRQVEAPAKTGVERHVVLGSRVSLAPPAGHAQGKGFVGYQWKELNASLVIVELPAAYVFASRGFGPAQLKNKGMTGIESVDTKFGVHDGKLIHATQRVDDQDYEKWIAVFGDDKHTVAITVSLPDALSDEVSLGFKNALTGATWDPKLAIDPFATHPWTVETPSGLKLATTISANIMFTETGDPMQLPRADMAHLVIVPSVGDVKLTDAREFAENRVRTLPTIQGVEFERSAEFTAGGRTGWEIVAKATAADGGREVVFHLVLLVGDTDYVKFESQAPIEKRDTWLPRLRACAASWKLKPPPEQK
jgi:hypothetical protein